MAESIAHPTPEEQEACRLPSLVRFSPPEFLDVAGLPRVRGRAGF